MTETPDLPLEDRDVDPEEAVRGESEENPADDPRVDVADLGEDLGDMTTDDR